MSVTENLEAALQQISSEGETFRIWIDALCINQNNLVERSHEVKRMKEIYRGASKVVVWLGQKTQYTTFAFDFIQEVASETRKRSTEHDISLFWHSIRTDEARYTASQWRAFAAFLELLYWHRLWIIQELAMANSDALIAWGDNTCSWWDLCKAYETIWALADTSALRICQARRHPELQRIHLHEAIVHLHIIINIREGVISGEQGPELMKLLDLSRHAHASDPRDHVYGLTSLFRPELSNLIVPNYEASASGVFRDFALSVINATGTLDIIYHGRRGKRLETETSDLPSWATDGLNGLPTM